MSQIDDRWIDRFGDALDEMAKRGVPWERDDATQPPAITQAVARRVTSALWDAGLRPQAMIPSVDGEIAFYFFCQSARARVGVGVDGSIEFSTVPRNGEMVAPSDAELLERIRVALAAARAVEGENLNGIERK